MEALEGGLHPHPELPVVRLVDDDGDGLVGGETCHDVVLVPAKAGQLLERGKGIAHGE